ncbi:MAG: IS1182 family transposase [Bacteroidota bacterium]
MHYKDKISREQLMVMSYDAMVAQDNAVRLIDLMCKKFFKELRNEKQWKGCKNEGRKSYPPESMLCLLVYGYFNGIASSRKLERETYRNIEVLWLMEGLQPDHWTICEFRRESEAILKSFLKLFRRFLIDGSYASIDKIVFDGTKVKAYARRDMLTVESLQEKLIDIDKSISAYLSKVENNDNHENEMILAKAEIEVLKEKIKKLETAKIKFENIKQGLEESGETYYAVNDKEAKLVRGRDGKFAGYNVQAGVETKGHFIMVDRVTTETNDMHELEKNVDSVKEATGFLPKEVSADKGYSNTSQILEIEKDGNIQCYIPLIETMRESQEKQGITFQYNETTDAYTCSQGKQLRLHQTNAKIRDGYYNIYQCHECNNCIVRNICTKSKIGRILKRNINQKKLDQYKIKMKGAYAKEKIKQRKGVVEHPFGTIKSLMGKFNILLIGKQKVQIEIDYYTTAYNLKRLINCAPFSELINKVKKYEYETA